MQRCTTTTAGTCHRQAYEIRIYVLSLGLLQNYILMEVTTHVALTVSATNCVDRVIPVHCAEPE